MAAKRNRLKSPYLPKAPPRPATARQSDYLDAVRALTLELGRGPTAVEVAARLGVAKQSARQQLQALEVKGLLRDMPKLVSSGRWQVTADVEGETPPKQ